ncbi:MAG: ATP phosphoribosyltransferase [Clostridiales bacterium]|nr:ATP phosphoribosyltransferase [Candidatus Crickella merdequi]
MNFRYSEVLDSTEKRIYELRLLYAAQGYVPYKMSKFEEYDFYGKNRDFLVSDKVLTFTDTNGKLMALKPDVTLSIIKNNTNSMKGGEDYAESSVQKLYYNENVYRVAKGSDSFNEIMQVGVECIGDVETEDVAEILTLAVKSLMICDRRCVVDVSDLDILAAVLNNVTESTSLQERILKCVSEKNIHGIKALCKRNDIDFEMVYPLLRLIGLYGPADEIMPELKKLAGECGVYEEAETFEAFIESLDEEIKANILVDFSVVNDMNYYNGIVFKGFVEGIPGSVLSGGSYDRLMSKMKRKAKGIGFAINMDMLDRVDDKDMLDSLEYAELIADRDSERKMLNVALPKGRLGEKVYAMFEKAGFECPSIKEDNRKLIFENEEAGVRYFWVKPSDVAIYVERGAADIGVAGKDILLEYEPDIYELLDMNVGKCRMAVAGPKDYEDNPDRTLRVATKFVRTAREYYTSRGRDIDIIHLNGSIEIAPILGLSDVIVDIVETGTTLRENNLEVKREIFPISARLIANKSSFKFKNESIEKLLVEMNKQIKGE